MRFLLLSAIMSFSVSSFAAGTTGEVSPHSSGESSQCAQAQLIHCDDCVKRNCPGIVNSDLTGNRTPNNSVKGSDKPTSTSKQ